MFVRQTKQRCGEKSTGNYCELYREQIGKKEDWEKEHEGFLR